MGSSRPTHLANHSGLMAAVSFMRHWTS